MVRWVDYGLFLLGAALALALSACAGQATPTKPSPSASRTPLATPWRLTFERSGGLAGLQQSLTIESSGEVEWVDLVGGEEVVGQFSAADLEALQSLLEESAFFNQPSSQSGPCADCFDYRITLEQGDRSYTIEANDVGLESRLSSLVQWLSERIDTGLSPRS